MENKFRAEVIISLLESVKALEQQLDDAKQRIKELESELEYANNTNSQIGSTSNNTVC